MRFFLFFYLALLSTYLRGQDTIVVNKFNSKTEGATTKTQSDFEINNRVFIYNDTGFFGDLPFSQLFNSAVISLSRGIDYFSNGNPINSTSTLSINSCKFLYKNGGGNYNVRLNRVPHAIFSTIVLNHFYSNDNLIFDIKGPKDIFFDNCSINGNFEFYDNPDGFLMKDSKIDGDIIVSNSGQAFGFENTSFGGAIHFWESKVDLDISHPKFTSKPNFLFLKDTIFNLTIDSIRGEANLAFENCTIDGVISITYSDSLNIIFKKVQFTNRGILSLYADSIIFSNCAGFNNSNVFSYSNKNKTNVCFQKTDFSNLQMEYKNLAFFSKNGNNDELSSMYERAITKFKEEGKKESLMNSDIDFKKYQYSKNSFWGATQSLVDKLWWNYGYTKSYIVYWTLFFVFIFFTVNFINWKHLNEAYPILNEDSYKAYQTKQKKSITKILLFTVYIFFSLRIDFNKLKFSNTSTLTWFFIQYLTGLLCMFFIANAILKFG